MRELIWMLEGKNESSWAAASALMALVANCHRGKGRAFGPDEFNPLRQRVKVLNTDEEIKKVLQ